MEPTMPNDQACPSTERRHEPAAGARADSEPVLTRLVQIRARLAYLRDDRIDAAVALLGAIKRAQSSVDGSVSDERLLVLQNDAARLAKATRRERSESKMLRRQITLLEHEEPGPLLDAVLALPFDRPFSPSACNMGECR